jgi:hypothetical protein
MEQDLVIPTYQSQASEENYEGATVIDPVKGNFRQILTKLSPFCFDCRYIGAGFGFYLLVPVFVLILLPAVLWIRIRIRNNPNVLAGSESEKKVRIRTRIRIQTLL